MSSATPGDEGKDAKDAAAAPGGDEKAAKPPADDDWLTAMPEALRKQMQQMLDMYLGAGIIMTKDKFMEMAKQGAEQMGKTVLLTLIRSPAEEFNAVEDGVLEKISKMSPQEATNLLPHAARSCCGPVLEALIRQGADLNSFNFQRGSPAARLPLSPRRAAVPTAADARVWWCGPQRDRLDGLVDVAHPRSGQRDNTTEAWQRDMKCDAETAEAVRLRQHGDVIESVRHAEELRPTLDPSASYDDGPIYKEGFPYEPSSMKRAPATDE